MSSDRESETTGSCGPLEDEAGTQYLTFELSDEIYGVDILRVQEIRGWEQATPIPNAPPYVKGVINLRGAIVPIFDLRQRFELMVAPYSKETVVVVLRLQGEVGERSVGVVVDGVSDVVTAADSAICRTPDFGANVSTESIRGLLSHHGHMIMLLDVDNLIEDKPPCAATAA